MLNNCDCSCGGCCCWAWRLQVGYCYYAENYWFLKPDGTIEKSLKVDTAKIGRLKRELSDERKESKQIEIDLCLIVRKKNNELDVLKKTISSFENMVTRNEELKLALKLTIDQLQRGRNVDHLSSILKLLKNKFFGPPTFLRSLLRQTRRPPKLKSPCTILEQIQELNLSSPSESW